MRQRRKNASQTLTPEEPESSEGGRFFACYLLMSRCPRFKGHTYIGFTVNPRRRIRQHNGEIGRGAGRTKKKRPWEMAMCIYGFPTNTSALQFEWAWQNPYVSKAVRKAAANFKSLRGFANKIKLAYTMLTLPPWDSLNLTVNFFSTEHTKHAAGCPRLPEQMKVKICPMDELPSCISDDVSDNEDEWYKDKENDEAMNINTLEEAPPDSVAHSSADDQQNDIGNGFNEVYPHGNGKGVVEDECYNDRLSDEAMNSGLSCEEALSDHMVHNSADDRKMDNGNTSSQGYGSNTEVQEDTSVFGFTISPVRMPYSDVYTHSKGVVEDEWYNDRVSDEAMNSDLLWEETLPDPVRNLADDREMDNGNTSSEGHGSNKKVQEHITREFGLITSPVRMPCSEVTSSSDTEASNRIGLCDDSSVKLDRTAREQPPTIIVADDERSPNNSFLRPCNSEVVDLITPSPRCRNGLRGKKSRVPIAYPEIIDLTKSPNFIQL